MIKIGGSEVKEIYVGQHRVYQGYCGSNKFYEYATVSISNVRSIYSSGSMLNARGDNYLRVIADVVETIGGVSNVYTDVELTPISVSSNRLIINGNYIYGRYLGDTIVGLYREDVNYSYHGMGNESVVVRQTSNSVAKSFTISINNSAQIAASGGERYIDISDMGLYYSSGYTSSETIDINDVVFDNIVSSEVSSMSAQVDFGDVHDFDVYFPDFYKTLSNSGYYDISCSVDGVNSNVIRVNHSANSVSIVNELWTMVYGDRTDYWSMDDDGPGMVPVRLFDAAVRRYTSGAEDYSGEYISAAGWNVYDDDGMINRVDEVDDTYNVYINGITSGDRSSSIEFESGDNSAVIEFYQEVSDPDPESEGESESVDENDGEEE